MGEACLSATARERRELSRQHNACMCSSSSRCSRSIAIQLTLGVSMGREKEREKGPDLWRETQREIDGEQSVEEGRHG